MRCNARPLACLVVATIALSSFAARAPASPAASKNAIAQAQRFCEGIGWAFFDAATYPTTHWVCLRGGQDLTDHQRARAARLCRRAGGIFTSGFDGQLYFGRCAAS